MSKDFIFLLIITSITVMTWLVFDIYHTRVQTTLAPRTEKLIEPISPIIDLTLIQELKGLD